MLNICKYNNYVKCMLSEHSNSMVKIDILVKNETYKLTTKSLLTQTTNRLKVGQKTLDYANTQYVLLMLFQRMLERLQKWPFGKEAWGSDHE